MMNQNDNPADVRLLCRQRDYALACMFLSLIIALLMTSSLLVPNRRYVEANLEIIRHEILLAQNEGVLNANKAELAQDRLQLEKAIRDSKRQH
jgi:hypothetical protein